MFVTARHDTTHAQFHYPRNKLLSLVLLFDAVVYIILIGLSYGVSDPTTAAQVLYRTTHTTHARTYDTHTHDTHTRHTHLTCACADGRWCL